MSDGPYREQALVPVEARHEIVRADEIAPPSRRLAVVDYDDDSMTVCLRNPGGALSWFQSIFAVVLTMAAIVAAIVQHRFGLLGIALCGPCMLASVLASAVYARLEIIVDRNGISWRRHGEITTLLIGEVREFISTDIELRLLGVGTIDELLISPSNAYQSGPAVRAHELKWLAGRLNRALARVKR